MTDDSDEPGGVPSHPVVPEGTACVLWHRRHLRVPDQPAVTYATRTYETVCPLFVFDPHFYGEDALACDARRRFLHESLADPREQYDDHDIGLVYAHGDPLDVLARTRDAGREIVATARAGWRRALPAVSRTSGTRRAQ